MAPRHGGSPKTGQQVCYGSSNVDPFRLFIHASTKFMLIGISCQFRPSSVRPASRLLHTTPLFEENRDLRPQTLTSNIRDPFLHDWPRAGTRLATEDGPVNTIEIQPVAKACCLWLYNFATR